MNYWPILAIYGPLDYLLFCGQVFINETKVLQFYRLYQYFLILLQLQTTEIFSSERYSHSRILEYIYVVSV